MYTFYADDTYGRVDKEDHSKRLHLFGGFLISKKDEPLLLEIIKDEKAKYSHPNLPIKWNFKDPPIKEKFEEFNRGNEYKTMLAKSNDWRREIVKRSLDIDYKIICSIIEPYSTDLKTIKKSKPDFLKFSLENILMRVSIDVKGKDRETLVVLDWPPDNNPQPFVQGYYRLFHTGKSSAGSKLQCGKLSDCQFYHSLLFAKCNHSPMLQFSDILIGSIKDYIECKLSNRQSLFATEIFQMHKHKIRNLNNKIIGYGLITPSGNTSLKNKLKAILEEI